MHRPCIRNNLPILLLHIEFKLKRKIKFSFSIHGKRLDGENAENSKEVCLITRPRRGREIWKSFTRVI